MQFCVTIVLQVYEGQGVECGGQEGEDSFLVVLVFEQDESNNPDLNPPCFVSFSSQLGSRDYVGLFGVRSEAPREEIRQGRCGEQMKL